jgi:hypothetical protein
MAGTKRAGSKRLGQDAGRQDGEGKDDSVPCATSSYRCLSPLSG